MPAPTTLHLPTLLAMDPAPRRGKEQDDDAARAPPVPTRRHSPGMSNNVVINSNKKKKRTAPLRLDLAPPSLVQQALTPSPHLPHGERILRQNTTKYPGAVPVLPGMNQPRAYRAALKAAAELSTTSVAPTSNGVVSPASSLPTVSVASGAASTETNVTTVTATVVSQEEEQDLERLRHLMANAVSAQQVTRRSSNLNVPQTRAAGLAISQDQDAVYNDKLTPLLHSQEGLIESTETDRVKERNSGVKITKNKSTPWWKAACCGHHAAVLESVVVVNGRT